MSQPTDHVRHFDDAPATPLPGGTDVAPHLRRPSPLVAVVREIRRVPRLIGHHLRRLRRLGGRPLSTTDQANCDVYGIPFMREHLRAIKQCKLRDDAAGHPDDLAVSGSGMTVMCGQYYHPEPTDRIAACAGIMPSEEGRARAWLILAEGLRGEDMAGVCAALRSFFGRQRIWRIELPVPQTARTTIRWVREIGFRLDVPDGKDFGDGTPYALFVYEPELPHILQSLNAGIAKATAEGDRDSAVLLASRKGQLLKALAAMSRPPPSRGQAP